MPYIMPRLPLADTETRSMLRKNRTAIRKAFAEYFEIEADLVAWEPRLLSSAEVEDSENLNPLEFCIDTHTVDLNDAVAYQFERVLLRACPGLNEVKFGTWLRSMTSNGFSQHTPA